MNNFSHNAPYRPAHHHSLWHHDECYWLVVAKLAD